MNVCCCFSTIGWLIQLGRYTKHILIFPGETNKQGWQHPKVANNKNHGMDNRTNKLEYIFSRHNKIEYAKLKENHENFRK